ncbi:MAG: hypothetical protein ABI716_02780 [Candidatus Saccharibacteria bacterium]
MADKELDDFINQILDEKQLDGVSDVVREQLVADLKERLLDQINRALIEELPPLKLDEFNNLLDDETLSDEQIQRFVADSGVDINRVTLRVMMEFSELYLGRHGLDEKKG